MRVRCVNWARLGTLVAFVAIAALLGCSHDTQTSARPNDGVASVAGSSSASGGGPGDSLDLDVGEGGAVSAAGELVIVPADPVLTATLDSPHPSVTFQATLRGSAIAARWSFDRAELGSVDETGRFSASGEVGGVGRVSASFGGVTATTSVSVNLELTEQGDPNWKPQSEQVGPGGFRGVGGDGAAAAPSPEQRLVLDGPVNNDQSVVLLYPYAHTVFPQGLLAPLLQWDAGGHAFDAAKLTVEAPHFRYQGYFAANHQPFRNLIIPQAAWEQMTHSAAGQELAVSLVLSEGTKAYGPYTSSWVVAPAVLHGTIYYNSYGTSYVTNSPYLDAYGEQFGAGTLGIAPGATAPRLVAGVNSDMQGNGCRVCHTVSGDGGWLVTQANQSLGPDYSDTVALNLTADATQGVGLGLRGVPSLTFPALSRDGKLLLSSAGGIGGGDSSTRLYAMPEAKLVPNVSGLPGDFKAALPAFSPDGRHVSFNFWGGTLASAGGLLSADKASLAVLDFDGASVFSEPRVVFSPPSGASTDVAATFSAFLPDSAAVVFALQLVNKSQFWGYTWGENESELWWVDLATKQAHRLDALNGTTPGGASYLPDNAHGAATHRAAQEPRLNYEPSVSPIAAGGYAWVVFTSRRMYGNVAALAPWKSDPRNYKWREEVTDKKLWVAAIDLNAPAGTDPSHPAFYLPAQELFAGNSRGFWSFDPCRQDGQSCDGGDQCCGGYCQQAADGTKTCGSSTDRCSLLYDKCVTTADCCDAAALVACVNGVCTANKPPR